ncbi:hypothetical protein K474DRAFT_1768932 [Panus rudis PR-1116 ss-1]|nr:hypothetical protein K474DRAFT_1768932 [Panus rudis PR-1116 ss-1]
MHTATSNPETLKDAVNRNDMPKREPDPVLIAIMGGTGTGKSSFINLVSGGNLEVGTGLLSCTQGVEVSPLFEMEGRRIILIDTPGFDDTQLSDTEILTTISLFLSAMYEEGKHLNGVLFFHRISDFRVGGISRRNIEMFRSLCGDTNMGNVAIVTNMWGEIDFTKGEAREKELREGDLFFKPALDHGASLLRHDGTTESAENILRSLIYKDHFVLQLQRELIIERKDVAHTTAGLVLDRELTEQAEKYEKEMKEIQDEVQDALDSKDKATADELTLAREDLEKKRQKAMADRDGLKLRYRQEKGSVDMSLTQLKQALQKEQLANAKIQRNLDQSLLLGRQQQQQAASREAAAETELRQQIVSLRSQVQDRRNEDREGVALLNRVLPAVTTVIRTTMNVVSALVPRSPPRRDVAGSSLGDTWRGSPPTPQRRGGGYDAYR